MTDKYKICIEYFGKLDQYRITVEDDECNTQYRVWTHNKPIIETKECTVGEFAVSK